MGELPSYSKGNLYHETFCPKQQFFPVKGPKIPVFLLEVDNMGNVAKYKGAL